VLQAGRLTYLSHVNRRQTSRDPNSRLHTRRKTKKDTARQYWKGLRGFEYQASHLVFLQRGRIARNAERCISHDQFCSSDCLSVCLSGRPTHAGTLSRRIKTESRGLHCEVTKAL